MKVLLSKNRELLVIFGAIAQAILIARIDAISIATTLCLLLSVIYIISKDAKTKLTWQAHLFLIFFQIGCFGVFCKAKLTYREFYFLPEMSFNNAKFFVVILAIVLALFGYYYLAQIATIYLHTYNQQKLLIEKKTENSQLYNGKWLFLFYCFVCSSVAVTICSECSILYPANSWVDPNCFHTVGKAMWNGYVPYRDLFEQKGPLFYFLYGLGWLISGDNVYAIFLFEVLTGTLLLYYMAMLSKLYYPLNEWLYVPLLSLLIYTSRSFVTGGSCEELCLPLSAYVLYLGLRIVKQKQAITQTETIIVGFFAGIAFWIKFTFFGFYFGWFLYFLLLDRTHGNTCNCSNLKRFFNGFVSGFFLITFSVLFYFGWNHALKDLFEVYFYDNIILYSGFDNQSMVILDMVINYAKGISRIINGNTLLAFIVCLELIIKRSVIYSVLFFFSFLFSFAGKNSWTYYALAFVPFSAIGAGFLIYQLNGFKIEAKAKAKAIVLVSLTVLCFLLTPNRDRLGKNRMDLPQYQFAKIIRQSNKPTLLNYGFMDKGFYMAAGVLPTCRAFCRLNAPIPEMFKLQDEFLNQGKCEYVVASKLIDAPRYNLVSECDGYYLYQLCN